LIEFLVHGEKRWERSILDHHLDMFVQENILEVRDGMLYLAGDEFDRLYIKYFAREKGVSFRFGEFEVEKLLDLKLLSVLTGSVKAKTLYPLGSLAPEREILQIAASLADPECNKDIFAENQKMVTMICQMVVSYRSHPNIPIFQIAVSHKELNVKLFYYFMDPGELFLVNDLLSKCEELSEGGKSVGADLNVEELLLPVVPLAVLSQKLRDSSNQVAKARVCNFVADIMANEYVSKCNTENASLLADFACTCESELSSTALNNIGYLLMSTGRLSESRDALERAWAGENDNYMTALISYNWGILDAKEERFEDAVAKLDRALEHSGLLSESDRRIGCLIIPRVSEGSVIYEEIREPDILECAKAALETINTLLTKRGI
jgi:tetratricopeptide (TPR) repeat protein